MQEACTLFWVVELFVSLGCAELKKSASLELNVFTIAAYDGEVVDAC